MLDFALGWKRAAGQNFMQRSAAVHLAEPQTGWGIAVWSEGRRSQPCVASCWAFPRMSMLWHATCYCDTPHRGCAAPLWNRRFLSEVRSWSFRAHVWEMSHSCKRKTCGRVRGRSSRWLNTHSKTKRNEFWSATLNPQSESVHAANKCPETTERCEHEETSSNAWRTNAHRRWAASPPLQTLRCEEMSHPLDPQSLHLHFARSLCRLPRPICEWF